LASVTGNDTGGIFQVIKRLNPRVKWIIAVSITLTISGICILASFGVVGIHSKKSGFGTDESKSLQEEVVDGARKPTFYPSAIGTEAFTSGLQTYKPSFSPTSTNNPSKPKMTINPSAKPALPEPNQEKINPSALPTSLPLLLQGPTLSSNRTKLSSNSPTFQPSRSGSASIYAPHETFSPSDASKVFRVPTGKPSPKYLFTTYPPTNWPSSKPSTPRSSTPNMPPNLTTSPQTFAPNNIPSFKPTESPSIDPKFQPYSPDPQRQPSYLPTFQPIDMPNRNLTAQPTRSTSVAAKRPSDSPSSNPSPKQSGDSTMKPFPTSAPSLESSNNKSSHTPTIEPTLSKTPPTQSPAGNPSLEPTRQPSANPTIQSTQSTLSPTNSSSRLPSIKPTKAPSRKPTLQPYRSTSVPSRRSSRYPSSKPSMPPSASQTMPPTQSALGLPRSPELTSIEPTILPQRNPTIQPTTITPISLKPQISPIPMMQTTYFEHSPTNFHSNSPSSQQKKKDSNNSTPLPTRSTEILTKPPTTTPTTAPSPTPSANPTMKPIKWTLAHTDPTTIVPTLIPNTKSSQNPTFNQTKLPSETPTKMTDTLTTSSPTMSMYPTSSVSPSQEPRFQPHPEPQKPNPTYFNYNPASIHGPNHWGNITVLNSTDNYWHEFGFVENRCNAQDQSPIDVCTKPTRDCKEHHEFRTRRGDYNVDSELMEKQILHNKLRVVMARRIGEEPDPPQVDFAGIGSKKLDMLNIDIKLKSEHTICGRRFDGEMQYYFFHPVRQALIAIAWLFEAQPENPENEHLQLLIEEFQNLYDENSKLCSENENTNPDSSTIEGGDSAKRRLRNGSRREQTKLKYWDPFHSDIQKTIHFWGYTGSLTEPPCTDAVLWRIMDVPVQISTGQLNQLQNILFNYRSSETCAFTSSHFNDSVARPLANELRYYKCTRTDYVSDDEREICGDSGCDAPFGKDLQPYVESIVYVSGPPTLSPTMMPF